MTALITEKAGPPEWWTADDAERAATMLSAALAEAGYPVNVQPDVLGNVNFDHVPDTVAVRARSLVFLRMGVDFEWCPLCPDTVLTRVRHEQVHAAHNRQLETPQ